MNNNSNHNNKIETEINGIVFELDKSEHTASIIRASCTAKKVLIPKSILYNSEYYSIINLIKLICKKFTIRNLRILFRFRNYVDT